LRYLLNQPQSLDDGSAVIKAVSTAKPINNLFPWVQVVKPNPKKKKKPPAPTVAPLKKIRF
jgi:hypothetical protein